MQKRRWDKECDKILTKAEKQIRDESIWRKYSDKFQDIIEGNMASDQGSYFEPKEETAANKNDLGYSKFFATPVKGDRLFDTHRVCEPGADTEDKPIGANDDKVFFSSLDTTFLETEWVDADNALVRPQEQRVVEAFKNQDGSDDLNPWRKLHQNSVFHPKKVGNFITAIATSNAVSDFAKTNGHCLPGEVPTDDCKDLPWTDGELDLGKLPADASIGYTKSEGDPIVTRGELNSFVEEQIRGAAGCLKATKDNPKACAGVPGLIGPSLALDPALVKYNSATPSSSARTHIEE
ncbi:hypothetical protein G7Y89_g15461 [Cudoniella acicularis]|uniref:Uncharacterized protein n=1 Tax=Cudoniella acicularis TaxID=354080 RepID=A0A8H4QM57_9HELO|nr:hypothetical protein G7Y89_g15461 [Cudoniella acicularis]